MTTKTTPLQTAESINHQTGIGSCSLAPLAQSDINDGTNVLGMKIMVEKTPVMDEDIKRLRRIIVCLAECSGVDEAFEDAAVADEIIDRIEKILGKEWPSLNHE